MTMQTNVIISITESARRRIILVTEQYEAKIQKKAIPAIIWLNSECNTGLTLDSQPVIGFYHDRSEIEREIRIIDGLEVVLAIPDNQNARFQGKLLDYENDRFLLR
jgi:hypothetical protein